MRISPFNPKVSLMKYEIREIVDLVSQVQALAPEMKIEFENIGDPIAKGWPVPPFLKTLLHEEIDKPGDKVFGYTHSRGNPDTREWIVNYSKRFSPKSQLDKDNVLITSGLGAGIAALYHMLPKGVRILQPTPSYPTHSSMESFSAEAESVFYKLDPQNDWQVDFKDMEEKINAHPEVAGILLINPNNPTGAVYNKETVERVVDLAEKYGLMILSDEIYFRLVYNEYEFVQITEIAHNRVPLIVMRGLSKDVPWPGARCGWLEFHNTHLNEDFKNYCDSVKKRVLMEVCSVTMPQVLLPRIYDHPEFEGWLAAYKKNLEFNSNLVAELLKPVEGLQVIRTNGAFYMMVLFKEGLLTDQQHLPISDEKIRALIEGKAKGAKLDQRFAYYLLGATGICVVPASGFFSPYYGFRITTLTRNEADLRSIYKRLAEAIQAYLAS